MKFILLDLYQEKFLGYLEWQKNSWILSYTLINSHVDQ